MSGTQFLTVEDLKGSVNLDFLKDNQSDADSSNMSAFRVLYQSEYREQIPYGAFLITSNNDLAGRRDQHGELLEYVCRESVVMKNRLRAIDGEVSFDNADEPVTRMPDDPLYNPDEQEGQLRYGPCRALKAAMSAANENYGPHLSALLLISVDMVRFFRADYSSGDPSLYTVGTAFKMADIVGKRHFLERTKRVDLSVEAAFQANFFCYHGELPEHCKREWLVPDADLHFLICKPFKKCGRMHTHHRHQVLLALSRCADVTGWDVDPGTTIAESANAWHKPFENLRSANGEYSDERDTRNYAKGIARQAFRDHFPGGAFPMVLG